MNSPEYKNIVCRICLDENVAFDWNNTLIEHGDVTYKDCYHKYTQLKQLDDDPLSTMLCENCSNGLEDVHSLIMKAVDSYNFLVEVNCVKLDTENADIEDEDENCPSTEFETVLVEKPEHESIMLQQFEFENFDECSVKTKDDELNSYEYTDEMQYQEMFEIEEQEDDDENQCIETIKVENSMKCEIIKKTKRNSCKRKFEEDTDLDTKIYIKKSRNSYSHHKNGAQSLKIENKYDSFNETSLNSDSDDIDTEELQYEDIFDELEEYEANHGTQHSGRAKEVSIDCKGKRKISGRAVPSKKNLEHNIESNAELRNSSIFNTRHKNDSLSSKLENNSNASKTKNSGIIKANRTKAKKYNQLNSQNTPRMCSYCSKILHNKYALQKHEKIHLANRERKAACPICGVKFLEESYVKTHMQIHDQDRVKKHKCEFCDKAFFEKGSLNVHRRIHLGQMIPCTLCSKEFFRQVDLDIHMNSHSANVINAETKKRSRYWVRCKHCNKDIMSTSFKAHNAVHLNEPQMRCSICNREFFRRDSCTDHLKTVHKKTTEEYNNFIIIYNKNRLSHLLLEQTTELKK